MPPPSAMLRMVAFAVAAGLAMAGVQPLVAAATGSVDLGWALSLSGPALTTAMIAFVVGRLLNRGDLFQPPWYSAWLLLPGSFLLAGAAAMCIFGALVEFTLIPLTLWVLLVSGAVLWTAALVLVRSHSH
jgi:hypothetical protein